MAPVSPAATPRLHYIFDPFCGWCWAVAPLIAATRQQLPQLPLVLHGGGMLTGAHRRPITPEWRAYVLPHDARIAELTGQPFGEAYREGLLRDASIVLDSAPPTAALLAAEALAGQGGAFLARAQQAHFVEGRSISDPAVLDELAAGLGLDAPAFAATRARLEGTLAAHFASSRQWLQRLDGQGFPTLGLERADGRLIRLEPGRFLGQPAAWLAHLNTHLNAQLDQQQTRRPTALP